MKLASARISEFKRFSDLEIRNLPDTARLIVLLGPNGCGKSSFFDALQTHLKTLRFFGFDAELWSYLDRLSSSPTKEVELHYHAEAEKRVSLQFHGGAPASEEAYRKSMYLRTAYRNEPSFRNITIGSPQDILEDSRIQRLIDDDKTVIQNYNRMLLRLLRQVTEPGKTTDQIMQATIGDLRSAMKRVFGDLVLDALVTPEERGSFTFSKGEIKHFLYENLSGGEKAAFDLLLDIVVKRRVYDDSLYCIDEPELHLNTRLQGRLLEEIWRLIPSNSQLWIATHSIGMVRKAEELRVANAGDVVFLDFGFRSDGIERNFDQTELVEPSLPNRQFWSRHYDVALDDMAQLIAPEGVVLCEGYSAKGEEAFDDACYNRIFAEKYPRVQFISVGSASDVEERMSDLVPLVRKIIEGTAIVRFRDRDDLTPEEVEELDRKGTRVLKEFRNLESLLLSDNILWKLCIEHGDDQKFKDIKSKRDMTLEESIKNGKPTDDLKPTAQAVHQTARRLLRLDRSGSSRQAFMRDFLAPLVTPDTEEYKRLERDVFG